MARKATAPPTSGQPSKKPIPSPLTSPLVPQGAGRLKPSPLVSVPPSAGRMQPSPLAGPPKLGPPAPRPQLGPPAPRPKLGPPAPQPKFQAQGRPSPKPGAPTRDLNAQRSTRVPPSNPLIKAGATKPTPQANTVTGPLLGSAARSRMGEGARAGMPAAPPQSMMGESARPQPQPQAVPTMTPPVTQSGMGESARTGQPQPAQAPQTQGVQDSGQSSQGGQQDPYTGISSEYDDLLSRQMQGERDRQSQGGDLRQAMRDRASGLISQVQMPNQDEFTQGYDNTMKDYQTQLDGRRSQQDQMFKDLLERVSGKYTSETSQANNAYGTQQSTIAGQQAASSQRLGEITGGLSTSGLPPEVVAALQARNQYQLGQNVSAANQSNTSNHDAMLQRAQSARETNMGNIYNDQNRSANDLLSNSAKDLVGFLNGRSASNARFYSANQGGVKTQGSIIDNLNTNEISLLDKMTRENPGLAQAMKDVSAGVRGEGKNDTSIQRQGMQGDVSMSNNANTVEGGITQAGIRAASSRYATDVGADGKKYATDVGAQSKGYATDVGAASKKYATDVGADSKKYTTDVGADSKKYAVDNKVTAPKVIHGNTYLATQPMGDRVRKYMRELTSTAAAQASIKKMPDGTENPYYHNAEGLARGRINSQTALDPKVLNAHADGFYTGKQVGGSAPKGSSGSPNADAAQAFQSFKRQGLNVDGFGSSSAAHKIQNPTSDHDTGRAFDFHETGRNAVEKAMSVPGVRYLINQNKIYTKTSNGWNVKFYGGTFANGQRKDDHANHVHVNF